MNSQIYYSDYSYNYRNDYNIYRSPKRRTNYSRSVWEPEKKKIKFNNKSLSPNLSKITLKQTIQSVCLISCSLCLIYQSQQLVSLYVSGKTVVENRIERIRFSPLPAITVCLPSFMDMKKFAGYFMNKSDNPEYQGFYKEFLTFERDIDNWNGGVEGLQNHLYWNFQWNAYLKNMQQISLADLLDKISTDIIVKHKTPGLAFNDSEDRVKIPEPKRIHSLVAYQEPRKCITLFSDLDTNFRNKNFDLIYLEVQFQHNIMSFPLEKFYKEDLYVTIHSPNILPDYTRENVFQKLEMGVVNYITYSESRTELLPPPYETKCKEYKLDDSDEKDMRNDCVLKCMIEKLEQQFGLTCVWTYNNNKLMRVKNLSNHSSKPLCNHDHDKYKHNKWTITDEQFSIESECNDFCPNNCIETFYTYDIERGKGETNKEKHGNHFTIHLEHSRFPDHYIQHKPIMSWTTLLSNLGGLLGMWLELSILVICKQIINKLFK